MLRIILATLLMAATHTACADVSDTLSKMVGLPTSKEIEENKKNEEMRSAWQRREAEEKEELKRIMADDNAERERQKQRHEEHIEAVSQGKTEPETIEDLQIVYDYPDEGWDLAASPKLDADGELYIISGVIQKRQDGFLLCLTVPESQYQLGDYFAIKLNSKTKKPSDMKSRLRINGRIFAVGFYLRNLEYTTIAAEQKIMPIFDAAHVIIPYD